MKYDLKLLSIGLILSLIFNLFLSIYIFQNGFLLRRQALNTTNKVSNEYFKRFNRSIVILVDGLRYDFAFSKSNNSIFGIRTIEELIKNDPKRARVFKFMADVN
jgi:predicted AlkP superfamily pyrophosphatase or phosphodiesterase